MEIDARFLRVHPATEVWWQQREQCESCRHMMLIEGNIGESIMRCRVSKNEHAGRFRRAHEARGIERLYCIDARSPDHPCGPDGKLWIAK